MEFEPIDETEAWDAVEAALTPKQIKVVNFFFGQYMRMAGPEGRKQDPKIVRRMIIKKLSIATYEEEIENGN